MLSTILAASLLVTLQSGTDPADFERDRFAVTTERLADDIYVLRRDPSWRFPVQANTLVIVNDHDVIVVDGGFPSHVEFVVEEIRALTPNPVSMVINTHWHGDHNVGQRVYRDAFPDVRFIAHETTRHSMVNGAMDYVTQSAQTDIAALADLQRETIRELEATTGNEGRIAYIEDVIAGLEQGLGEYQDYEMILADETFSERMTIHRGDRRIELLWLGRANTDGDAVIWLPQDRIVATGDTVVLPTPYGFGSFPGDWTGMLRSVIALDYDILVPGHGQVQRDTAYIEQLIALLDTVSQAANDAVADGTEDPAALRERIDWQPHVDAFAGDDALLVTLFDRWFQTPIVTAALAEARVDAGLPAQPEAHDGME